MNKSAIFTIAINDLDYFKYTLPTIHRYAEKTGSDFIELEKKAIDFYDLNYEKYYLIELLNKYERVLHLDADVIVTPNARNIFKLYPDENKVYAYNENGIGVMNRDSFVEDVRPCGMNWHKANGRYIYFNAGVVLLSGTHKSIFDDYKTIPIDRSVGLSSQTLLNYFVAKNNVPYQDIGYLFNRMYLGNTDAYNDRYEADFIHYAGDDKCMGDTKLNTIKNDYKHLYNGS
jgi:lipopolysaccharide biosynthesis glycosyltransferase